MSSLSGMCLKRPMTDVTFSTSCQMLEVGPRAESRQEQRTEIDAMMLHSLGYEKEASVRRRQRDDTAMPKSAGRFERVLQQKMGQTTTSAFFPDMVYRHPWALSAEPVQHACHCSPRRLHQHHQRPRKRSSRSRQPTTRPSSCTTSAQPIPSGQLSKAPR